MTKSHESDEEREASFSEMETLRQSSQGMADAVDLSRQAAVQDVSAPDVEGYVLTELLGVGAYGQVWRGVQLRTQKEVAVKVFIQKSGLDWIFLQREVERLSRLDRHPHIVTLLDTNLEADTPSYVMDLIEGGSLQQFVGSESPASPEQVIGWAEQICQALSYVHGKGLIHCDLKPGNILVDEQNNVRVVDFGQSRVFTESSASLGTLYYMAPEQAYLAEAGKPVHPDVRWDIYALGATIYAMLFGHPPHASAKSKASLGAASNLQERLDRYRELVKESGESDPEQSNKRVGREFRAVLSKCVAPDPDDRYESVAGVLADLAALKATRPVSPLAGSRVYRARKFIQRNPLGIGLVVAALILLPTVYVARQEQANAAAASARDILAAFVHSPVQALSAATTADRRLRSFLVAASKESLSSPAYTHRIMGARSSLIVSPEAFWASVDGGELWEHGEWLEVAEMEWPDDFLGGGRPRELKFAARLSVFETLADKAANGSGRQKYVAFCLLGEMCGSESPHELKFAARDRLKALCASAVANESAPGVVAAARWAAARIGVEIPWRSSERVFVDEGSGLTFVRLPGCDSFRRGALPADRDQFDDEALVETGTSIGAISVSVTEVPLSAMEPFVNSVDSNDVMGEPADGGPVREVMRRDLSRMPFREQERTAAGRISLDAARSYCGWLNARAADLSPKRSYRLPTEEEWEYTCRAGNSGRFCYGNDAKYASSFAHCNGSTAEFHTIAQKMPNWYGLFDMHGGLWEWCDSRYEERFAREQGLAGRELFVWRGGGYYGPAIRCRSTQRNRGTADAVSRYTGFRLVMEFDKQ